MKQYNIFGDIDHIELIDNEFTIIKTTTMEKKKTQVEKVLNHLIKFGTITSWEAIQTYRITRLSDKIYLLRKKGINISTIDSSNINQDGIKTEFATYKLIENGK